MNRIFFALLLISFSLTAVAQNDYIITSKGDSLSGTINFPLPGPGHEEVHIKIDKKKQRLKSYQVNRVVLKGKEYHVLRLGEVYKFMLLKKPGYTSLYQYRTEGGFEFSSPYLKKNGGKGIDVPNLAFRRTVGDFVSDCPELQLKINNRSLKKSDIEEILDLYNACAEQGVVYKSNRFKEKSDSEESLIIATILTKVKIVDPESEIINILEDIQEKIDKKEEIPGYLKSALKDQSKDLKEIKSDVNELLKKL